jgi:hypothetical protein
MWLCERWYNLKEGHKVGWDEARILDIESHVRYRKQRNRPLWHAQPILSVNPVWTYLTSGSPRLPTHREDPYDVTDSSWVSVRFQY